MVKLSFALAFICLGATSQSFAGVSGVYDANNVLVGEYAESVSVIHSVRGFRFSVDGTTGAIMPVTTDIAGATYDGTLLYSTLNCTGQAYITTSGASGQAGGIMVNAGNKGIYYVPKTPIASVVAIGSTYNGSSCGAITPSGFQVVPVLPNDPAVTGVPNTPFTPPIHLEMVPLSQFFQIFKNGFESSFAGYTDHLNWQTGDSSHRAGVA